MPKQYYKPAVLIVVLVLGGLVGGIAVSLYVPWYVTLTMAAFGAYLCTYAMRMAAESVLKTALHDSDFYEMVRQKGILRLDPRP